MARLLITGASGLLGANLVLAARDRHEVTAVCHRHPIVAEHVQVIMADLTRPSAADELLADQRPTWVVHCAAAAEADRCEQDPAWASLLNIEMAARVAAACERTGARLVHVSTDAVFDGERGGYREDDLARPVNAYGRTKLEGERAVLAANPGAAVLRTNFFGWHAWGRHGLAEWFLARFESSQAAPGFVDAFVAPLLANDLAELILAIAGLRLTGVYHINASECLSKYEFGRRLARLFGFEEALVEPVTVDEAGLIARRPRNLCLDCSRLRRDTGLTLPGVSEGLSRFRQLRETGFVDELKSMVADVLEAEVEDANDARNNPGSLYPPSQRGRRNDEPKGRA